MIIFYYLKFEISPAWRTKSPYIHLPGNRVVQLYPEVLGSLFVTSFDSQGYGGGIRTRIHTGY
jgi:hypothetical protein